MALFKCKMCGGELEVEQGASVGTCKFCGSKQTLPKLDDDRRANMYDRANHLRRANEFDKAARMYEQILNEDPEDSEAYWSLVLCEFGIEYVEDPETHKRVPTVHRVQYDSILTNTNYELALKYADDQQRSVYEDEAKAINGLQKNILAISQNEEPFDIFICYKETDENGNRTHDSVDAYEIYHSLVDAGYKVFFSRVTLESKLGVEYEPYIFAALNSAKVMIVIGSKVEYFNAVWVKNEWSRFLALIRADRAGTGTTQRVLIPAYRGIDPYDLPEEFSHVQAIDISKIGALQDLHRNIGKLFEKDVQKGSTRNEAPSDPTPLLKRTYIFLEDGNWREAEVYSEKVLDIDPENAYAYVAKLLAKLRLPKIDDLAECPEPFDNDPNYEKAIRYGDEKLVDTLRNFNNGIRERNEQIRINRIYSSASQIMESATGSKDFEKACSMFSSIPGYLDSDELAAKCKEKAQIASNDELYAYALSAMEGDRIEDYENAIRCLNNIPGWRDADEKLQYCETRLGELQEQREIQRRDTVYNVALSKMSANDSTKVTEAINEFSSIPGWRDADAQVERCRNRLDNLWLRSVISERTQRCDNMLKNTSKSRRVAGLVLKMLGGLLITALLVCVIIFVCPKLAKLDFGEFNNSAESFAALLMTGWPLPILIAVVSLFPLTYSIWTMTRIAKSGKEMGFSHNVNRVKNELLQIRQRVDTDDTVRLYSADDIENIGKTYTAKLDELARKNANGPKNAMYGIYKVVSVISPAVFCAYIEAIMAFILNHVLSQVFTNKLLVLILTIVAAVLYAVAIIIRFRIAIGDYARRIVLFVFGIGTPIFATGIAVLIISVIKEHNFWNILGAIVLFAIMYGIWKLYNWLIDLISG